MNENKSTNFADSKPASVAMIYSSEFDYLSQCILDYPNIETGGQLFGFLTEKGEPVVCYAIGPGPRANHQTAFYQQDLEYLESIYWRLNKKYGLSYIGEWHSHHQLGLAKPSGHDAASVVHGMKCNRLTNFLLCIGNCDNSGHSTLNAFTFHNGNSFDYYHAPWKIIETDSPYRSLIDKEYHNLLCHPKTSVACHGFNYLVEKADTQQMKTPDFKDDYWLNFKENNVILKNIIDYLESLEEGCVVSPQLDGSGIVLLTVCRKGGQEQIVFSEKFPREPPQIITTADTHLDCPHEWKYEGSIYDSFILFYNKCTGL